MAYACIRALKFMVLLLLAGTFFLKSLSAQQLAATQRPPVRYMVDGRYIDVPDLVSIIKRVSTAEGIVDPEFNKLVDKPSRYYTDFYGIQALKTVTKGRILHDFVPKYAWLQGQDEHSITLKFKAGWTGKFYVDSALEIQTVIVPYNHMYVSGDTFREFLKNLDEFRDIVAEEKLESAYFVPNEHYRDELVVYRQMHKNPPPARVTFDPDLTTFSKQQNAVLIYPEAVHGNLPDYEKFIRFLNVHHNFDWIGMEMLTSDLQPALDAYSAAPENSPKFADARRKIVAYFSSAWNGRFGKPTTGEDNEYFKIVELLHRDRAHIYGMESTSLAWIIFRYGETPFGGAVRSYLWSKRVPVTGRGIVHGGSAHFDDPRPVNFQDFFAQRNRKLQFYAVRSRERKK